MIPTYDRGRYFLGLMDYLLKEKGTGKPRPGAEVMDCQGVVSAETAHRDMTMIARHSDSIKKPVVHVSISIAPGEQLTRDQWLEVVDEIEKEMKLAGHQRVVVAHNDTAHPHVHICWNAIHPVTHTVSDPHWDSNIKYRLMTRCRQLEALYGLSHPGQGRYAASQEDADIAAVINDQVTVTAGQRKQEQRTGVQPLQVTHGAAIKAALRLATWDERAHALAELGLQLEPFIGANRKRQGLVVVDLTDRQRRCSGSSLGSDYALGALNRRSAEPFAQWWLRQAQSTPKSAGQAAVKPLLASDDRQRLWVDYLAAKAAHQVYLADWTLKKKAYQAQRERAKQRLLARQKQRRRLTRQMTGRGIIGAIGQHLLTLVNRAEFRRHRAQQRAIWRERLAEGPRPLPTWSQFLQVRPDDAAAQQILVQMNQRSRLAGTPTVSPAAHATDANQVARLAKLRKIAGLDEGKKLT